MKRQLLSTLFTAAIILFCLSITCVTVSAEEIESGKSAELNSGNFIGGIDIPIGSYVLSCNTDDKTHGIVWLSSKTDNLEEDYPSILYESVSTNETRSFYIPLREGWILHTPFRCVLTSVDYLSETPEELHTGMYVGGTDLPVAKYQISYKTDDFSHGIIWLADVNDDFENEYPSMLYENISTNEQGSFYLSMEKGRTLFLPVTCKLISQTDAVVFQNNQAELLAGQYLVGDDIPAGTYDITCKPQEFQNSGLLWVSAPEDNLKEDYPSVLYKHVTSDEIFHVTVQDGARIFLPFPCIFVTSEGGVVFK